MLILFLIIYFAIGLFFYLGDRLPILMWILPVIAIQAIYAINWRRRRAKAGELLLILEPARKLNSILIFLGIFNAIFSVVGAIFTLFIFKFSFETLIHNLLGYLNQLCIGISITMWEISEKKAELREKGICNGLFVFKWKQIKSYQWNKNILYLRIKSTWIPIKSLNFQVIATNKERVEQLLIDFLSTNSNH